MLTGSEVTHDAVTVLIVHRDRPDVLAGTVRAYRRQTVRPDVLVIDNGSGPASSGALRDVGRDTSVVLAHANLGFGPGANLGLRRWLRRGEGTWVVVTPHDSIPEPDTLERMLDAVRDRPRVGLLSGDVGDGARPVIEPYLGAIGVEPAVEEGFDPADYPHGTLLMARRECLEEVGLFDERYFAYCEEADLGLRARAAGWEVGVIRRAMVTNPGMSAGVAQVAYLQHRNMLLLQREHFGRRQVGFRIAMAAAQIALGVVHPDARGLHWSVRGRLLGIRDHLLGSYGPPPRSLTRG